MTGNEDSVTVECLRALWLVLELIGEATVAAALGRQTRSDRIGLLLDQLHPRKEARVAVQMVVLAANALGQLLDPSLRRAGWFKLGGKASPEPGGFTRDAAPGGKRAQELETDLEVVLWAIRQSLSLVEMLISTTYHPPRDRLARELVDQRTRGLGEDDLERIRSATELVRLACQKVLPALQDASEETGN